MSERGLNGPLKVLAYLLDHDGSALLTISRETGLNYRTVRRAVDLLQKLGFVVEEIEQGPPVRKIIKLTEKGRKAAEHAKALLELAGMI
ncbi:hypothetical protein J4526_01850 [Desulfurococcaceae archaeon MEX13E-LK6-19]|nr:hypothetical protein J4526_01850 [Desulfurococcaceae archaeon MEX13E-LK6-19]